MTARALAASSASDSGIPAEKIPPTILPNCGDWHTLLRTLKEGLPPGQIEAKSQGSSIRLLPRSIEAFREVQKILIATNRQFHIFALPTEREIKVVISGNPHTAGSDLVKEALEDAGYTPTYVANLTTGKKG